MNKINTMNMLHRVFLGWLASEIADCRVPAARQIADMEPIDLDQNRDLFLRFLREHDFEDLWWELEDEHGPTAMLTYHNG